MVQGGLGPMAVEAGSQGLSAPPGRASPCVAAGDLGDPVSHGAHIPSSTPAGPALAPARVPAKAEQALLPEALWQGHVARAPAGPGMV